MGLTDAYNTLQTFLGGLYVNDFAVSSEKRDEARFFEAVGGGLGMQELPPCRAGPARCRRS